eukprot:gnl/MRDRNA2_/MRDRNA2_141702_c0_seq1.p1 gnl/MRDRNA2_/MRDRNA2_141702_c0~~gnl/MRDRNA2_/MRDRNA2_141702_c0_seq1.p1  ORF type:complete len:431 (+),score=122.56 gnl/MRDRNA2_/MRDRNA2_141702_c0_seq1:120-1295(+)
MASSNAEEDGEDRQYFTSQRQWLSDFSQLYKVYILDQQLAELAANESKVSDDFERKAIQAEMEILTKFRTEKMHLLASAAARADAAGAGKEKVDAKDNVEELALLEQRLSILDMQEAKESEAAGRRAIQHEKAVVEQFLAAAGKQERQGPGLIEGERGGEVEQLSPKEQDSVKLWGALGVIERFFNSSSQGVADLWGSLVTRLPMRQEEGAGQDIRKEKEEPGSQSPTARRTSALQKRWLSDFAQLYKLYILDQHLADLIVQESNVTDAAERLAIQAERSIIQKARADKINLLGSAAARSDQAGTTVGEASEGEFEDPAQELVLLEQRLAILAAQKDKESDDAGRRAIQDEIAVVEQFLAALAGEEGKQGNRDDEGEEEQEGNDFPGQKEG